MEGISKREAGQQRLTARFSQGGSAVKIVGMNVNGLTHIDGPATDTSQCLAMIR
jgi:hypothetical protein